MKTAGLPFQSISTASFVSPDPQDLLAALNQCAEIWLLHIERRLNSIIPSDNSPLSEAITYFRGTSGKRFRPLLTLMACEILGSAPEQALEAACAVELVHESSLIFDDLPCMDNADLRRGQDTLHRKYGVDTAILSGIYLLNEAYRLLANYADHTPRLVQILTDGIGDKGMVAGQALDLIGLGRTEDAIEKKTGSLIRVAIRLGAATGNASPSQEYSLIRFADRIGRAFQLRDDILDGDEDPLKQQHALALAADASRELFAAFGFRDASLALAGMAFYAVQWNR